MVKISIKKAKTKAKPKPKQKQKQKQSQKVIVNFGSNAGKARRASTQALQKNAVNRSTPTPNIIVPQAMPQNSNIEILKYIRESEQQKEMIKKQEKSNELEKDKIKAKEKTPIVIPEEDAQTFFSAVNSQNISSLTSGTSTPNPLSSPVDSSSLFTTLSRIADINGENPNSGSVSLTFDRPNPLSPPPRKLSRNPANPLVIARNVKSLLESFDPRGVFDLNPQPLVYPVAVDDEPPEELKNEVPILVNIDPEPQLQPIPTDQPEEEYIEPEDEEPPEEPPEPVVIEQPQVQPLVIEPAQPEAVILPIQPEAQLLYEEEDKTERPKPAPPKTPPPPLPQANQPAEEQLVELKSPSIITDITDSSFDNLRARKPHGVNLKLGKILMDSDIEIEGETFSYTGRDNAKRVILGKKPRNFGNLMVDVEDAYKAGQLNASSIEELRKILSS